VNCGARPRITRHAQLQRDTISDRCDPGPHRWCAACPPNYRHPNEIMQEHGVSADHSSINGWVIRFLPLIEGEAWKWSARSGASRIWIRRTSRSRASASTLPRCRQAMQDRRSPAEGDARHCCGEARRRQGNGANGDPDKVAMGKSGANSNNRCNQRRARGTAPGAPLTYLNNIVEQDHCAIKRVRRPMLNFKSLRGAGILVSSRRRFGWPINAWQETGMNADRPWLGNLHL
jgi:putative transposase